MAACSGTELVESTFRRSEGGDDDEKHVFEVQVYLGGLDPNTVRVELYAEGLNDDKSVTQEMTRGQQLVGANGYVYTAEVPAARSATDYTARVIPHHSGAVVNR